VAISRAGRALTGAALVGAAVLGACASREEDPTACELLKREVVARQVPATAGQAVRLRRSSSESLDQSICGYRGWGVNVRLNVDSAPEVRRRYFNRVTEALQFSVHESRQRPRAVKGLGDDDALGPAGAYWIPGYRQLFVLRGERQFVYQFSAPGVGPGSAQRAVTRIAAQTLPGERTVHGEAEAADRSARPELLLAAPRPGEVVRGRSVVVRGTVSGAPATVQVQGVEAPISAGTFARRVPLRRGTTRIRISASTPAGLRVARTVTVRRGRSPAALGAAFAQRRPGRMPDLLAAPLPDARALLRAAGIPYRVIRLADTRLPDSQWTVCSTRPAPDARLGEGEAALLRVDAADLFRASGTACARE
jgi:Glucodextranase, domain B